MEVMAPIIIENELGINFFNSIPFRHPEADTFILILSKLNALLQGTSYISTPVTTRDPASALVQQENIKISPQLTVGIPLLPSLGVG